MTRKTSTDQSLVPELSQAQIEDEEAFLEGIPRFDVAALLGAPIWGPAQGIWSSILFYPLWLIADNFFVYAAQNPNVLSMFLVVVVVGLLIAFHVFFMRVSVPIAWHRAFEHGVSKATFLKRQRIWAIVSVVLAILVVGLATYYHLIFEPVFS